jgi:hypothetical protein
VSRTLRAAAVLASFYIVEAAEAQTPTQLAVLGCRNAAAREVRRVVAGADSVQLDPNSRVHQSTRRTVDVDGSGRFYVTNERAWRRFTYDCIYHTGSAKTRVWIEVQPTASRVHGTAWTRQTRHTRQLLTTTPAKCFANCNHDAS